MKISSYGNYDIYQEARNAYKPQRKDDTQERIRSVHSVANKKKQKSLNYNYKEISSALRKSSKSSNAALVLTKAKSKLSTLLKCKGTGQYSESELAAAITHAKKLVRCANMKLSHLKQEEQKRSLSQKQNAVESRQKNGTSKAQEERRRENEENIEKLILNQHIKSRQRELYQKCKGNRNRENMKLEEADWEYLKKMIDTRGGDSTSQSESTSIGFDSSMPIMDAAVTVPAEVAAAVDGSALAAAAVDITI